MHTWHQWVVIDRAAQLLLTEFSISDSQVLHAFHFITDSAIHSAFWSRTHWVRTHLLLWDKTITFFLKFSNKKTQLLWNDWKGFNFFSPSRKRQSQGKKNRETAETGETCLHASLSCFSQFRKALPLGQKKKEKTKTLKFSSYYMTVHIHFEREEWQRGGNFSNSDDYFSRSWPA